MSMRAVSQSVSQSAKLPFDLKAAAAMGSYCFIEEDVECSRILRKAVTAAECMYLAGRWVGWLLGGPSDSAALARLDVLSSGCFCVLHAPWLQHEHVGSVKTRETERKRKIDVERSAEVNRKFRREQRLSEIEESLDSHLRSNSTISIHRQYHRH